MQCLHLHIISQIYLGDRAPAQLKAYKRNQLMMEITRMTLNSYVWTSPWLTEFWEFLFLLLVFEIPSV